MDSLIYAVFLLGSYSLGYGLLRAGFPLIQKRKFSEKMAFGYAAGAVLFGLPFFVISFFNLKDLYYPLACIIVYFFLLLLMLLKRTIFNETDAPTKEEIAQMNRAYAANRPLPPESAGINYSELVKDENANKLISKETPPKENKISFDQGLMVKSRKPQEQVFKEENKNIMGTLSSETKRLNKSQNEEQKNSMLAKLREYAQEINAQKKDEKQKKKNEEDENEEELLTMFKDTEM